MFWHSNNYFYNSFIYNHNSFINNYNNLVYNYNKIMKSINKLEKWKLLSKLIPFNYSKKTKLLICGVAALVWWIISLHQWTNTSISKIENEGLNQNQFWISDTKIPWITKIKNPLFTKNEQSKIENPHKYKNSFITYKIKWWDTLRKLSTRFNINIDELIQLNKISNPNLILVWDIIIIPNNIWYIEKDSTINLPKISKKKISQKIKPIIIKNKKDINNNEITDNKQNNSNNDNILTFDIPPFEKPTFDQKLKEETFILNKKNFEIIYSYAKIFHKKNINKILASKDTNRIKQKKIIELYFRDEKCFDSRISIKEINKLKINESISNKVHKALELWWYNITVNELLKTIMKVESSWWLYINFVKLAWKASDDLKKELYIKKAIDWAVWISNDCWPFNITPNWLDTELKYWGVVDWKIEKNINKLRQLLKIVFEKAVREKLNEKQIICLLKKVDIRFDIKQMSTLILNSFARIHWNLKTKNVNNNAALKWTIMAYNIWETGTYNYLKKDKNLWQTPIDTEKKLSFLKIASIKNDTLIKKLSNTWIKTIIGKGIQKNNKIAKIIDYYPKAVKIITSHIKDEYTRLSIQKKLWENPLIIIDKHIKRIREKWTKQEKRNILSLYKIRNKIEKISLQEFNKAA